MGAITKNTEKPYGKSEYNEEVKLLKKMLPLLAKYKVLQLDKDDKTNDVQSETQLFSGLGRKIKPNINHGTLVGDQKTNSIHENTETKHKQQGFPVSFSKVKETPKDGFQNSRDPGRIKKQNNAGNMEITNFNHANDILHNRNEKVMALSKQSKLTTSSENINIQKIPHGGKNVSVLPTAILNNQTVLDLATPEQSKIAFDKNMENTNTKANVLQTTLHHTKLTNKDGSLEIINKLPASDNSSITKPKIIHTKAEAIGEIFKALGSNNKIVKDANGLYLISGKHVKIIHRTHGSQARGRNFGENKDKETALSSKAIEGNGPLRTQGELENKAKTSEFGLKNSQASLVPSNEIRLPGKTGNRGESFKISEELKDKVKSSGAELIKTKSQDNLAPVLQINSTNSGKNQQGLPSNILNGIERKFGLDLSAFNLRDLEYKLQSNSKSTIFNRFNKTTEEYEPNGISLSKNGSSVPNNRMFPPKEKNSPYTKVENRNERKIQWKFAGGDSYINGTVPNVVNNKVVPPKEKDSSYTNAENGRKIQWKFTAGDSYTNGIVPNVVNNKVLPPKENHDSHTNVKDKDEGVTKWGISDAYSSSTQPLHTAGKPLMKNENLSNDAETHDSNPVNFTSKFTDDVSNFTGLKKIDRSISDYSLNTNLPNGITESSTPSLGKPLSENRYSEQEHRLPSETVEGNFSGEGGQLNSSQSFGDGNFTNKLGHNNLMDLHVGENDQTSSNNIGSSRFAKPSSNDAKNTFGKNKQGSFNGQFEEKSMDTKNISETNKINRSDFTGTSWNNRKVPLGINKADSFSEEVRRKPQDKSSVTDEKLSDVRIEVIDEAKGETNMGTYQTSTDVKQDSENVEIIDEGVSSQPPVKITPEDISSALQHKFGKRIDRVHSDNNWVAEKGTKLPEITEASKSSQLTKKIDGVGFTNNLESKKEDTLVANTKATGRVESKFQMSSGRETTLPEIIKLATGRNESKSPTSGSSWSMDVVGKIGKPQEETLGKLHRSETMRVATKHLDSDGLQSNTESLPGIGESPSVLGVNDHHPGASEQKMGPQGTSNNTNGKSNDNSPGISGGNGDPQSVLGVNDHHVGTSEQTMGPEGTNSNDNSLGVSKKNGEPERTSTSNQGEQRASTSNNGSGEPMIPKKVVDALLLGLTQTSQGRNSQNNQMNSQKKQTTKNLKINSYSTLAEEALENNMKTNVVNHLPTDSKQKVSPSKIPHIKTISVDNANLDKLLEKFVRLLSRHMKPRKTEKPQTKVKPHRKHDILSTVPLLKYEEKLLWDEQRKLEHQLDTEQKLLEESKLNENLENSKTSSRSVEVKLKKKIDELNEEKHFLLKKLKMLSFEEKYKTDVGKVDNDKLMIPNQDAALREVYGEPNEKSGTVAYMGSHATYNVVNNHDFSKDHGYGSELQHANEQLNQLLAEYEATNGTPNRGTADASELNVPTPSNSETHTSTASVSDKHVLQLSEPGTTEHGERLMENKKHDMTGWGKFIRKPELNSNMHEVNKVTSSNIRDFDNIPRYTADQTPTTKSFNAGTSEEGSHTSTEYPTHQHTSEYIHTHPYETQDVSYQSTTDSISTKRIPNYPTPSFINKEADYASDTAEKFADPFRESKTQDGNNFENLEQRTVKNSIRKSDHSDYTHSSNQGSQGVGRVTNIFPGTYGYGEEHEGTHWKQEDASLLKEMPEYSAKANTIESETQPDHYSVLTTEKDSAVGVKPQVTNTAGSDAEMKPQITNIAGSVGVREFRTGTEAFHLPIESQLKVADRGPDTTSKIYSQTSNRVGSDYQAEEGKFRPGTRQSNALDDIDSKVYPQTSAIVGSNTAVEREPGNELRNSLSEEKYRLLYKNSESQQSSINNIRDIHSSVQTGHYNMPTSRQQSQKLTPQVTNTAGAETEDDGDEVDDVPENSHQPIGNEVDGAFEVVNGGEVPTLRRNTDNPEDGVQDKTYINGDEYHLQKKYGIARKKQEQTRLKKPDLD